MTINEYQKAAMRTANPGVCDQLPNVALGLCGGVWRNCRYGKES